MTLALYADKSCVNHEIGHLPLLYPFWGNCDRGSGLDADRYTEWTEIGKRHIALVPLDKADAVVLPSEWRPDYRSARDLASLARDYGKPLVVFFNHDSDAEIPIEDAIVFRTSFRRSKRRPNEFAVPGWSTDFLTKYLDGQVRPRGKRAKPMVGYVGYVDYRTSWERVKYLLRHPRHPRLCDIGPRLRGAAVRSLLADPRVETSIILRDGCMTGGADEKSRAEYVGCIVNSDYSLVTRGGGNFSYRLYEVLSCGRIPLFLDTDCVLPFDHIIDWRRFCLWVDQADVGRIAEVVSDFHAAISDDRFQEMQMEARQVYERWICPTGFYSNIWRCIPGRL